MYFMDKTVVEAENKSQSRTIAKFFTQTHNIRIIYVTVHEITMRSNGGCFDRKEAQGKHF